MNKLILSILTFLTIATVTFGQAPEGFKYQAVVRDANSTVLNNQAVGVQLTIQQGSIGGMAVYTEIFSPTTNGYGLVNLEIGTGTTSDDFSTIDWANGPCFIETAIDVTGGTSYVVMGTSQLMSVPYALYAKTSGSSTPGPQGIQGPAGIDGNNGVDGTNGVDGNDGAIGPTGPQGLIGPAGIDGNNGVDGTNGVDGNDGAIGLTGPQGLTGPAGIDGSNGVDGTNGIDGNDGAIGITGPQGVTGPAGIDGNNGVDGTNGVDGNDGAIGPTGPQGLIGPAGIDGNNGVDGTNGIDGNDGAIGPTGPQGATGADGTFPPGTASGEMNYWDGSAWVAVPPGQHDQTLSFCLGVPTWGPCPTIQERLDSGESPCGIYDGGAGWPLDSLYGKSYLGGMVFYFDTITCQGFVVTPSIIGVAEWGCAGTFLGVTNSAIGTGYQNTQDIIAGCGMAGIAAELCTAMGPDWFLPSKDELFQVYLNLDLNGYGSFFGTQYWSSTERDGPFSWNQSFNGVAPFGNTQNYGDKGAALPVHAIRAF